MTSILNHIQTKNMLEVKTRFRLDISRRITKKPSHNENYGDFMHIYFYRLASVEQTFIRDVSP